MKSSTLRRLGAVCFAVASLGYLIEYFQDSSAHSLVLGCAVAALALTQFVARD